MGKLLRYYNTLKHLKPSQLIFQVIYRLKSKKRITSAVNLDYILPDLLIADLEFNQVWVERFRPELMLNGKVCLLNKVFEFNYSEKYLSSLSPLLRNNMLYMEYAIVLAVKYVETQDKRYVRSFTEKYNNFLAAKCKPNSYIYSLHIPNIIIALNLFGSAIEKSERDKIVSELYIQYRYVERHQERHLLANHYLENLKALILSALMFGERDQSKRYLGKLKHELNEQINNDGLHYELSSMYHKIILEDLLRLYKALVYFNVKDIDWLVQYIMLMTDAVKTLETGFNRTPLFNDSGDNVAKPLNALISAVEDLINYYPKDLGSLSDSGYYKLYDGKISVIIDAGKTGPEYQPGHVHNDCLSFELAYKEEPILVNCGTLLYQGEERKFYRSTKAHNTVIVGDTEQSECWSEHRVAKRSRILDVCYNRNVIEAIYKDYKNNRVKRIFSLANNCMTITDSTFNVKGKTVHSYLHIPAKFNLDIDGDIIKVSDIANITPLNSTFNVTTEDIYAPEFGKKLPCHTIEFEWFADNQKHGYTINFEK